MDAQACPLTLNICLVIHSVVKAVGYNINNCFILDSYVSEIIFHNIKCNNISFCFIW